MNPISIIAIIVLILLAIKWLRGQPKKDRRSAAIKLGVFVIALIFLVLAITGRMHWLGAVIAGLFPFARRLVPIAWRALAFWRSRQSKAKDHPPKTSNTQLSKVEALDILGLKPQATRDEIIAAHKRLMQKAHPDRGGNDWLASRINAAKDTLLDE